jgi:hypothetical protein
MDNPWLTFNDVALNVGAAGAVSAESTATVGEVAEDSVSGVNALSVT